MIFSCQMTCKSWKNNKRFARKIGVMKAQTWNNLKLSFTLPWNGKYSNMFSVYIILRPTLQLLKILQYNTWRLINGNQIKYSLICIWIDTRFIFFPSCHTPFTELHEASEKKTFKMRILSWNQCQHSNETEFCTNFYSEIFNATWVGLGKNSGHR